MANIINNMMDVVHDQSLPTIELLQTSFPDNKDFMINISTLFDPRYVFLIYAPVLFALNKRVGHRMIIALTLAEWMNQVLKWLLAGERPYWYVHEMRVKNELSMNETNFDYQADVNQVQYKPTHLKQFPVTCELGAGSPSGHSMVTATVWYIIIDAYLKNELVPFGRANYGSSSSSSSMDEQQPERPASPSGTNFNTHKLAKLSWSIYTIMLMLVSLSRVYLACHFPHQCICGALLGCLLARLVVERMPMEKLQKVQFVYTTCFMFATALSTYAVLRMTGFDPLWSVGKAMRWCVKKEYIHLDTTPFFSMMRYLGFCLGVGLAYDASKIVKSTTITSSNSSELHDKDASLLIRRILCSVLSVAFGQFLLAIPAPKSNLNLFYVISFVLYTVFSYAIAGPIPKLAKSLMPATRLAHVDHKITKVL